MVNVNRTLSKIIENFDSYEKNPRKIDSWKHKKNANESIERERFHCLKKTLQEMGSWPLKDAVVLDLGCGDGHHLETLATSAGLPFDSAIGIDLFAVRAQRAKERLPDASIVNASAHQIPFKNDSVDIVIAYTLLSSIPRGEFRDRVVHEIQRTLKPGGLFICYDMRYPNPGNKNVRKVTKKAIGHLFKNWNYYSKTLTLIPPICYALDRVPFIGVLYKFAVFFPFMRSHRLSFLRKPLERDSTARRILWIRPQEETEINRPTHQRLLHFSKNHFVSFLARGGQRIDPIFYRYCTVLSSPHWSGNLYLSHGLFYTSALIRALVFRWKQKNPIVYTFPDYGSILGWFLKVFFGFRWIADMVDDPALELQFMVNRRPRIKYLLYYTYVALLKKMLRKADAVLAIGTTLTEGLPETLQNQYRISVDKIIPVSNGIDLRSAVGTPIYKKQDRFTVLYLGGLGEIRGVDVLVDAAKSLYDAIPSLRVCLVGPPRQPSDLTLLKNKVRQNDLTDVVEFIGKVSHAEALNWMASSDVCVVLLNPGIKNFQYTFSVKLFEYLALNKAVVAPDLPGVRLVVSDRENGLLYEPGDPVSLSSTIQQLYRDRSLHDRLVKNARDSILAYDWSVIHSRIDDRIALRLDKDETAKNQ